MGQSHYFQVVLKSGIQKNVLGPSDISSGGRMVRYATYVGSKTV